MRKKNKYVKVKVSSRKKKNIRGCLPRRGR